MEKTTAEPKSKTKLSLEALNSKRYERSIENQIETLREDLRIYGRDLATVSLALVRETERRAMLSETIESTSRGLSKKTTEISQIFETSLESSLRSHTDEIKSKANNLRTTVENLREIQFTLNKAIIETKSKHWDLHQTHEEIKGLVSQMKYTAYRVLSAVSLLILILGITIGWLIPNPF